MSFHKQLTPVLSLHLLNPFALLCGVLSLAMLVTHGANWLQMKTTAALRDRQEQLHKLAH